MYDGKEAEWEINRLNLLVEKLSPKANSWDQICDLWKGNPLYDKISQDLCERGSYGHATHIQKFVEALLEQCCLTNKDESSYYALCLKYEVDPGCMGRFINGLIESRTKLQEIIEYRQCMNADLWGELIKVLDEVSPGWCDQIIGKSSFELAMKEVGRLAKLNYLEAQSK